MLNSEYKIISDLLLRYLVSLSLYQASLVCKVLQGTSFWLLELKDTNPGWGTLPAKGQGFGLNPLSSQEDIHLQYLSVKEKLYCNKWNNNI